MGALFMTLLPAVRGAFGSGGLRMMLTSRPLGATKSMSDSGGESAFRRVGWQEMEGGDICPLL